MVLFLFVSSTENWQIVIMKDQNFSCSEYDKMHGGHTEYEGNWYILNFFSQVRSTIFKSVATGDINCIRKHGLDNALASVQENILRALFRRGFLENNSPKCLSRKLHNQLRQVKEHDGYVLPRRWLSRNASPLFLSALFSWHCIRRWSSDSSSCDPFHPYTVDDGFIMRIPKK